MECLGIGGKKGELRDRHFCVYRKSTCKYMTMKQCPRLVIIDGDVRNGMLTLTTPEHEPIQVDIHKVLAANQIVNVKTAPSSKLQFRVANPNSQADKYSWVLRPGYCQYSISTSCRVEKSDLTMNVLLGSIPM
ncbi:unnamed protein product [Anisakis simplex]|uniref:MOSC_N domain-containing protein n=1 Tax=Anisakis simplex TaxID=6269 RepID=A0A0M3JJ92_ANISI|nr:unnamed protein product [Anisakis simplex]